jgi:hypothetical protein
MTATNGWPGEPGVPLNPEKEGWHWVHRRGWTKPMVWWPSKNSPLGGWWEGGLSKPHEIAEMTYLGPCLTPDQATALQSRVAELETALQFIKDAPDEERKPNFDNMGSYEAGLRYCAAFASAALTEGKKDE